jgi:hypothetical protein
MPAKPHIGGTIGDHGTRTSTATMCHASRDLLSPPRMDPPASVAVDDSSLCRACALCCDWPIFHSVPLERAEVEWAVARRLPLVRTDEDVAVEFPCSVLQARGDERVCGDYEHRPRACRGFECKVLARYKTGELSRDDAFALVHRARTLITSVERRLAVAGGKGVTTQLRQLGARFHDASVSSRTMDPELLLDLGILESCVLPSFHDGRKKGRPTPPLEPERDPAVGAP